MRQNHDAVAPLRAAVDRVEVVDRAGYRPPPNTPIALTLEQAQELLAQDFFMLTDMVVTAAKLWFGRIKNPSSRGDAGECLHEIATDLVAANPRLKGAFT